VAISGAGFKWSMRLGTAYNDFAVEGSIMNKFFKEFLQLVIDA
jgi:hypothetical protein